jgi:hypothetical protein
MNGISFDSLITHWLEIVRGAPVAAWILLGILVTVRAFFAYRSLKH